MTDDQFSVGATVWLTGLPSSGKSTIAGAVAAQLRAQGRRVDVLDGDEIRAELTADLGFSREDRITNVTRIGFLARALARNGVTVLVPVIAPYAAARDHVRDRHAEAELPYVEIHVATSVAECATRDVKGLYAKQRAGQLTGLTGVDDPYEIPEKPDLRLDTVARSLDETAEAVLTLLRTRGLA